ncbi:MAG: hypothetical protein K5872_18690 [Rhizobiaceae bacterium]|nr:hypothetical protein [Rhizobiaceae bacterium]MCV0408255.1 hypothetical protein [Rhizobiaceae bacterium]
MTEQLQCEKHGLQNEAFICSHLVSTLSDKVSRGLVWSRDEDGLINAYCVGCQDMLTEAGGEWTEELQEKAGIAIACEACIMPLFELNGTERPA